MFKKYWGCNPENRLNNQKGANLRKRFRVHHQGKEQKSWNPILCQSSITNNKWRPRRQTTTHNTIRLTSECSFSGRFCGLRSSIWSSSNQKLGRASPKVTHYLFRVQKHQLESPIEIWSHKSWQFRGIAHKKEKGLLFDGGDIHLEANSVTRQQRKENLQTYKWRCIEDFAINCAVQKRNSPKNDAKVLSQLWRILYIWHVRHPSSGYVQGINDTVTPFIVVYLGEIVDIDFKTLEVP